MHLLVEELAQDRLDVVLPQVLTEVEGRVETVEGGPEGARPCVVQQPAQLGQVLPLVGVHQVLRGCPGPSRLAVHGWGGPVVVVVLLVCFCGTIRVNVVLCVEVFVLLLLLLFC